MPIATNHSTTLLRSPLGVCYVTHITLADTPTRCASCNVA